MEVCCQKLLLELLQQINTCKWKSYCVYNIKANTLVFDSGWDYNYVVKTNEKLISITIYPKFMTKISNAFLPKTLYMKIDI